MSRVDELEVGIPLHLLCDRALQGDGDVGLPTLEHRQARGGFRHTLDDDALQVRHLTPVSLIGFQDQLYLGV